MNLIRYPLLRNFIPSGRTLTVSSYNLKSVPDIEKLEQESLEVEVDNEEAQIREEEIERKRNKSRLYSQHQNIVNDRVPHQEPQIWQHETIKYKRRMYGIYGSESGVNPSMCWPTEEELAEKLHLEKVTYPYTIQEIQAECQQKKIDRKEFIKKRQEEVVSKVGKLDQWMKDLQNRIAKKEAEAKAAKDRKDRLVEEVRRHFGYKVDPKEDKFKELLERKEKAEKKIQKEARRKAKEEKLIAQLKGKKPSENSADKNEEELKETKNI